MLVVSFSFHFLLVCFFGVLELSSDVVVDDVFVVVDVVVGSPGPDDEHSQSPEQKEDEYYAGADEDLIGDNIAGKVTNIRWQGLHYVFPNFILNNIISQVFQLFHTLILFFSSF